MTTTDIFTIIVKYINNERANELSERTPNNTSHMSKWQAEAKYQDDEEAHTTNQRN